MVNLLIVPGRAGDGIGIDGCGSNTLQILSGVTRNGGKTSTFRGEELTQVRL